MDKKKQNQYIYKICKECYGAEGFSACCDSESSNGRCENCGKFCQTNPCMECGGFSPFQLKIKDEVQVFLYKNSPEYLLNQFGKKTIKKGKFYKGFIKKIIDKETIVVKLSSRLITVNVDDIEV